MTRAYFLYYVHKTSPDHQLVIDAHNAVEWDEIEAQKRPSVKAIQ